MKVQVLLHWTTLNCMCIHESNSNTNSCENILRQNYILVLLQDLDSQRHRKLNIDHLSHCFFFHVTEDGKLVFWKPRKYQLRFSWMSLHPVTSWKCFTSPCSVARLPHTIILLAQKLNLDSFVSDQTVNYNLT